jgi:hypothetical protein
MGTIGGDLIRILAHGGINALTNTGSQLLTNYLQPGIQTKEALGKELIQMMGTNPNEATAAKIKELSGVDWPRAEVPGSGGTEITSPEGKQLTLPLSTPLTELASGYQVGETRPPETRLVPGAPSLDLMRADIVRNLPQAAREGILTRDPAMTTELLKKQMDIAARGEQNDLTREDRRSIAAQSDETKRYSIDTMRAIQEGNAATQRANAENRKMFMSLYGKSIGNKDEQVAHSQLEKANEQYLQQSGPLGNETSRVEAAKNFNQVLKSIGQKFPDLTSPYSEIPIETFEKKTYMGFGTPETKQRVGVPKSSSTSPTVTQTVPTPIVTPQMIEDEKRRRGLIR